MTTRHFGTQAWAFPNIKLDKGVLRERRTISLMIGSHRAILA
jgi:hypothetical protein